MGFTIAEKEARHKAVQQILTEDKLQALLIIGDTNIGHGFFGDYRYYTNNALRFERGLALVFPDFTSVLFVSSDFSRQAALRTSFMEDCRISANFIADAVKLLKERGISRGRVGVSLEMLPTVWYLYLRQELPQIEWVEAHDRIMEIRFRRSHEEAEVQRKGAALGTASFEAALKVIRPGITECEIAAEIEHYARSSGAEEQFTLIGSGKFALGEKNPLALPYTPSHRRVEMGDTAILEITPRYDGYWTQLVRMVNVGQSNADLEKMQIVCRDTIKKGLEQLKPGKRVMDVALAMESYARDCGYTAKEPFGHICGVDLVEGRFSQNERVLQPGLALIIHPAVYTPDGKVRLFWGWGETYLVVDDGYERLHHTGDEVVTI